MDGFWQQAAIAAVVIGATLVVAKVADRALVRHLDLRPETLTRYRVVRRTAVAAIIVVGVLSALLVIPPVRAVAGSILASSAVAALIVGFAAQTTLSNVVAGLFVAFTQPLRLGDHVDVAAAAGEVEEIRLTYTVIRADDGSRFFVPNARLAADTIRNSTVSRAEHLARVSVSVPIAADLDRVRELLVEEARGVPEAMKDKEPIATVSRLEPTSAAVDLEAWARTAGDASRLASALRSAAQRRLRTEGILAG